MDSSLKRCGFLKGFTNRRDYVRRRSITEDEYVLDDHHKVAGYDATALYQHWNSKCKRKYDQRPKIFKRLVNAWKKSILGNTLLVVLIYLLLYYLVNVLFIQHLCAGCSSQAMQKRTPKNQPHNLPQQPPNSAATPTTQNKANNPSACKSPGICRDYDVEIKTLSKKEATFTRLLTFLIGFYVSFVIARWWRQVTSVPTIDNVCLGLEGYLWCDERRNENEILVKEGVSVTQFKQTLVRYCLLSWTMCLSLVSPSLRKEFQTPEDFNKHRLMTLDEYNNLQTTNRSSLDAWKTKWSIPLIWANSMLNEADTLHSGKEGKSLKIKELKDIIAKMTEFQKKLHQVFEHNEHQIPHLILQAVKMGLWFWLLVGVVSSQGLVNSESNNNLLLALIFNFPALHIIQYIVMFGWLNAAAELQNPFGKDE